MLEQRMGAASDTSRWHGRLRALGALRGIAVVAVVFTHCRPEGPPTPLW
jgi:peptidoglycan/LPS O-acetylase OafA/YrhL